MMDAPDERIAEARSIVPEIRTGHLELARTPASAIRKPSRDSLSDLNLKIGPGERIGIIGRVASGKSTLGRLMCGLYAPTEGEMSIDGLDSRQYHPHQIREAFRYVAQDAELFSGTVRDNLMLGAARATDEQLIDAVARSGADIFLSRDAAGFDLPVGERGSRLSGGQRALLVLARALVTPSKMLFLDEPTGAMDTQTEMYFIDHLAKALAPEQIAGRVDASPQHAQDLHAPDCHRCRQDPGRRTARRSAGQACQGWPGQGRRGQGSPGHAARRRYQDHPAKAAVMSAATLCRSVDANRLAYAAGAVLLAIAAVLGLFQLKTSQASAQSATVTIAPAKAAALIQATTGTAAIAVKAVGEDARLINASMPFDRTARSAARARSTSPPAMIRTIAARCCA